MHLIDLLPAANWMAQQSDTSFSPFRELHDLMTSAGKLEAEVGHESAPGRREFQGQPGDLATQMMTRLSENMIRKKAAQSIARFSKRNGHSLGLEASWA